MIMIVTPKGTHRFSRASLLTFLLVCMVALAAFLLALGFILSLGALIAPALISIGWSSLKVFLVMFLLSRVTFWAAKVGTKLLRSQPRLQRALRACARWVRWHASQLLRWLLIFLFR